jgi:hypothetical protein
MISPHLKELEQSIRSLSIPEESWLLERLTDALHHSQAFSNSMQLMAQDPQIQAELVLMNQDFSMAEEDGLQDL